MTEERQLKIPYDDLKNIALECSSCGAEVAFDIAHEKHLEEDWEKKALRCTICATQFDSAIKIGLIKYADWFRCAKESGVKVSFRIVAR